MIKTKNDAKVFIENLKKHAEADPESGDLTFSFYDGNLFAGGGSGGTTKLAQDKEGDYYNYSFGSNWCDQDKSYIGDAVLWVWENRKWINKQMSNLI